MSKELIVAGSIVAACIGLSVVAFVNPGAKPAEPAPEPAMTQSDPTPEPDRWSTGTSGSTSGTDPFATFPTTTTMPERDPFALPTPPAQPIEPVVVVPPPAAPIEPPPAATSERSHVVAKGDTLGDISRQYYGTTRHWKKIQDANKVDPDGLHVGQKLVIPVVASDPAPTTSAIPASDADSAGLYVVKKGDSYYRIAERELGDPSRSREIERLNGVAPEDLRVGQKLKLPSRAATASPAPTSGGSTTSSPTVPPGARLHSVQKDEYLVDISEKYYGTTTRWKAIADANPGVNPNRLVVGQKLVIPDAPGASTTSGGGTSSASVVAGAEYVIKSGDTLERIAQRTLGDGGKWRDIAKLNPGLDPTRLMVGQKIVLPKEAQQSTPAPAPARPSSVPSVPSVPSPTFPSPAPAPTFPSTPAPEPTFPSTPAPGPTFPAPSSDTPFPAPAPVVEDPWSLPPAPAPTGAQPAPVVDDPWADFPGSTR